MEKLYKVSVVVHGKTEVLPDLDGKDPYELSKQLGIYQEIETEYSGLKTEQIIDRIVQNRALYELRNKRKQEKAILEEKLQRESAK